MQDVHMFVRHLEMTKGFTGRVEDIYYTVLTSNDKTTLEFSVRVNFTHDRPRAFIEMDPCDAATGQEAISRLGDWLSRAGWALKNRGEPKSTISAVFRNRVEDADVQLEQEKVQSEQEDDEG